MKPLVSIVTPTYNCAHLVADAINSVRGQTFGDWEHLIIDDASSDETVKIVAEIAARDARVKVIRQDTNGGAAVTRNRGIELARGRYIAFLDSDDLWYARKLELQLEFMRSSGAALSFTDYEKVHEETKAVVGCVRAPQSVGERELLLENQIACSTAMYDLSQVGRVFMPLIRKRQDWGLWLRIARKGFVGRNVGAILAAYRLRTNSLSSNKLDVMLHNWRFFRDEAKIPFAKRVYCISRYAFSSFRKYRAAARAHRMENAVAASLPADQESARDAVR